MPPKKRKATTSAETYAALEKLNLPPEEFSPGAVEALRLCHIQFLSRITTELAQLGNDDEQLTIQPSHVDECLEKMGFSDYTAKLANSTATSTQKKAASRSKKPKKWTPEMEAEQERLLAQSKKTVEQQQQQKQS
jgi:hypothetical protein